jgi:Xaa-Pro aminopeptidase
MFTSVQPGWLIDPQPPRSAGNKHAAGRIRKSAVLIFGCTTTLAGIPLAVLARRTVVGMPDIHAARRARVQEQAAAIGADAALITSLVNVRYLTGLASSNAALLVPASGAAILATDSRYGPAAQRDCPDLELVIDRFAESALAARAAADGAGVLGFEEHEMTVERHQALAGRGLARVLPLGRLVEGLRMVKDAAEIALLARACQITSESFEAVLAVIRPGVTERELALALEREMTGRGAEKLAFDTIVASGPNGDTPHHVPAGRPFAAGDLITIDCGARYAGYHADMTRTVAVGEPAAWQREIYDLVATAQRAGLAAAAVGAAAADVDAASRDVISAAGHGEHFGHGTGHGVGLEIHEAPMIGSGQAGMLAAGVPVTVEPGIYLPGRGGVRIEDTLVVRASTVQASTVQASTVQAGNGAIPGELLTTVTRELLVL